MILRYGPVILGSLVAGLVCLFFGIGIIPAIIVTIVAGSIGIALRLPGGTGANLDWPAPPLPPTDGDRRESVELSWAIRTRGGSVDPRIIRRVRGIAESRLALRQLDLDNTAQRAEIQALIGESTYDVLTGASSARLRIADVAAMLDILDRLHDRPTRTASEPTALSKSTAPSNSKK